MTTTFDRNAVHGATLSSSFTTAFNRLSETARAWLRRREAMAVTRRELDSLTDRELADIGISRFDIARVARDAADMA